MTWRGYVLRHAGGITPAQYAAMLEGLRFKDQQDHKSMALAVAWGINFAFADKEDGAKMLVSMGIEQKEAEKDPEDQERSRQEAIKLLHKIETAQIRSSETIEAKELA